MASMVELPGESNPLTVQNVLSALVQAASSTQQQVQTGGQQLQNWEKQEKYYTYLQVRSCPRVHDRDILLIDSRMFS